MSKKVDPLTDYQITELKKDFDRVSDKVDLVLTNHLPHLKEDIISLKTRINIMTGVNIIGIILGLIAAKLIQ